MLRTYKWPRWEDVMFCMRYLNKSKLSYVNSQRIYIINMVFEQSGFACHWSGSHHQGREAKGQCEPPLNVGPLGERCRQL